MPKTSDMGVALAHSLSPELALVCPELRERALALLPALDPDALFELAPRPVASPVEIVHAPSPDPLPEARVRPQLVLVEEQRRAPLPVAFAAYVAEAVVFGALRGVALIAVVAAAAFLLAR